MKRIVEETLQGFINESRTFNGDNNLLNESMKSKKIAEFMQWCKANCKRFNNNFMMKNMMVRGEDGREENLHADQLTDDSVELFDSMDEAYHYIMTQRKNGIKNHGVCIATKDKFIGEYGTYFVTHFQNGRYDMLAKRNEDFMILVFSKGDAEYVDYHKGNRRGVQNNDTYTYQDGFGKSALAGDSMNRIKFNKAQYRNNKKMENKNL